MKYIIIILIILICYYLYYENTTLKVTKYTIKNKKIKDNFKIAHISDFHNTKSKKLKNKTISKLKSNKVDIIVITGDLIDSRRTNVDIALEFIDKIISIAQIYYVTGNHEARKEEYKILKQGLVSKGVKVLENQVFTINKSRDKINILGIVDPLFKKDIKSKVTIKNEIDNLKYSKEEYNILLSHRPEHFKTYVEKNIDLAFTGHAHGGQVRLPFIGGLYAPAQGLLPKYTSGVYKESNTSMVVSRGIGASLFPFRINNRPELVIVSLKRSSE